MAEHYFKTGDLNSKKTKTKFYWLIDSSPAMFDIDFRYKVKFDKKAIANDFVRINSSGKKVFDWDEFYHTIIKKNFSERYMYIKAKYITISGFKVVYVVYNSEYTDQILNPKKGEIFDFKHTITLEATDKNKKYDKKEIAKFAQDFVNKAEPVLYSDTKYYKIIK